MGGTSDQFEQINSSEFLELLLQDGAPGQKAFAKLFRVTHGRFLGYVARHLSSPEECQEVLQETYLAVHRGLPKFERKSKLTTWMYSMAYHKICDRISDRDRGHQEFTEDHESLVTTESGENAVFADISPWDSSSDRVVEKDYLMALIAKAAETLPPAWKQVYHLRDEEGLSGEEIAAVLGIPAATVRVHLHRARGQIVEWVRQKLHEKDPAKACPDKSQAKAGES